uniref:Uncharacterized protein n=1 Tax=Arion vulgaris TaxID=1028688 RepID=A0A0B7AQL3_9EUPU
MIWSYNKITTQQFTHTQGSLLFRYNYFKAKDRPHKQWTTEILEAVGTTIYRGTLGHLPELCIH